MDNRDRQGTYHQHLATRYRIPSLCSAYSNQLAKAIRPFRDRAAGLLARDAIKPNHSTRATSSIILGLTLHELNLT